MSNEIWTNEEEALLKRLQEKRSRLFGDMMDIINEFYSAGITRQTLVNGLIARANRITLALKPFLE